MYLKQGNPIVLMFFDDVLKFFNRIGVRAVNDVTAQVTAQATAGMDPEGMGAHMGAGLQVVEAVPFDQSVLLNAINNGNTIVMKHTTKLNETTLLHVNKEIKKEGDARKKEFKGMKASFKQTLKMQNEDFNQANQDLQKRLELLEQGAATNKKPRKEAKKAPPKTKNIIWNKANDTFGWMKIVKGVPNGKHGFSSALDATLDMEAFFDTAVPGGAAGGSAGGLAGNLKGA